jgi:hypothetical protein
MTYSQNIEEDNIKHLNRFKNEPPHPCYLAGMLDGDGCIFIRKIKYGYQSGITLAQSRTNVLQIIRYHFGGSITSSTKRNNKQENILSKNNNNEMYYDKHNIRNQYNLLIRSNEYQIILEYIKDHFIIKNERIKCLYEFSKLANIPNKNEEKELIFQQLKNIKNVENETNKNINIEYIQGLFDAEGCVYIDKNKQTKFYISITQKKYPFILNKIKDFLGFGKIDVNNIVFKIFNKNDCLTFISLVKEKIIVKYNQIIAFEHFLINYDEDNHKICYKICNEEKHQIENFNTLNQHNENKNEYLETLKLRDIKNKICKEIQLKQTYKEKSIKMMGEGNHNYGKLKTEETKHKMSVSIRNAKNGVSDETILKVRNLFDEGKINKEIQELLNLSRYTVSNIKSKKLVCRNETKNEKQNLTQEQQNINRRKIKLDEIFKVIDKIINENKSPLMIFNFLNEININEKITIEIIKNIRKMILQNKVPFYEIEEPEKYIYYKTLIDTYYNKNIKI